MLPSLGKLRIPPACTSDTFPLASASGSAQPEESRICAATLVGDASILLAWQHGHAISSHPNPTAQSLTFDPPLAKCYKSTTSERRVPSLQGPCPGVEQQRRRSALVFQVSVPSAKWGFLVVWQAPPGATSKSPGILVCRKRMPRDVTQLTSKFLFLTEEC